MATELKLDKKKRIIRTEVFSLLARGAIQFENFTIISNIRYIPAYMLAIILSKFITVKK